MWIPHLSSFEAHFKEEIRFIFMNYSSIIDTIFKYFAVKFLNLLL